MTKSALTVIAALVGSAAFGSAALASGNYYPGVSSEAPAAVDTFQTSSIVRQSAVSKDASTVELASQSVDTGDYYQGANRPQ